MVCGVTGHKVGDLGCKALPVETITAFKGYQHPLSNHFPCHLNVYEHEFKSLEHAYFWHMATEFGQPQLATDIKNCIHAGEAKKLSKLIATDDERFTWESNNIEVMKTLLQAKANQCEQFRACLLENQGTTLAEATPSRLWGTGYSPYITEHSSPSFWLAQNMLGVLLTELTQTLVNDGHIKQVTSTENDVQTEQNECENSVNHLDSPNQTLTTQAVVHNVVHTSEKSLPDDTCTASNQPDEHTTTPNNRQQHKRRPRNRSSPNSRASRNGSNSSSLHRGSSKAKRTPLTKRPDQISTPTYDIRNYTTESKSKRKDMETTPESANDPKSQRQDTESGT